MTVWFDVERVWSKGFCPVVVKEFAFYFPLCFSQYPGDWKMIVLQTAVGGLENFIMIIIIKKFYLIFFLLLLNLKLKNTFVIYLLLIIAVSSVLIIFNQKIKTSFELTFSVIFFNYSSFSCIKMKFANKLDIYIFM